MKIITLLSGIMGSGKSKYIHDNNLTEYTISTDTIRSLMGQPEHVVTKFGNVIKQISGENNAKVFERMYTLIQERMARGEYIVIDSMNLTRDTQKEIKKLAQLYQYRINLVDIQEDMSLAQIQENNKKRVDYKVVQDYIVEKTFNFRLQEIENRGRLNISGVTLINKNELKDTFYWNSVNLDHYDKIFIIGDVHGCYTALNEGLGEIKDNFYYIFLGDLFDRGIENKEVFLFIQNLMTKSNSVFIEGNHEQHLQNFIIKNKLTNNVFLPKTFLQKTIPDILKGGEVTIKDMSTFVRKFQTFFAFDFHGQKYICTHGGIAPEQYNGQTSAEFISGKYDIVKEKGNDIIKGIGGYQFDIDYYFNQKQLTYPETNRVIQFHGHRNSFEVSPYEYPYIYNLENSVELGGFLRIAEITKDNIAIHEIKNNIVDKDLYHDSLYSDISKLSNLEIKTALDKSKYIRKSNVKYKVNAKLTAYNFTNAAFTRSIWNGFTTTARGLILRNNGDIFARGYNKFFNINENPDTTIEAIKSKIKYPVIASEKENGFLGISTGLNKDIHFYTKSGKTDFSDLFKNMFYKELRKSGAIKNIQAIQELLSSNKYSVAFEVINIENDKHIVTYDKSKLVILDVIENNYSLTFNDDLKFKLAQLTNFETAKQFTIKNEFELDKFIQKANEETNTEGYVFKDNENYMFKLKNPDYKFIKSIRSIIQIIKKRNTTDIDKLPKWVKSNIKIERAISNIIDNYDILNTEIDIYDIRKFLTENNLM